MPPIITAKMQKIKALDLGAKALWASAQATQVEASKPGQLKDIKRLLSKRAKDEYQAYRDLSAMRDSLSLNQEA